MIFLWIALYGMAYSAGCFLSGTAGPGSWVTAGFMAAYCLAFLSWILRRDDHTRIGLVPVRLTALAAHPGMAALLLLPAYNLLFCGLPVFSPAAWVLSMSTALVEELFFRGYLLAYLKKWKPIPRILAVSGAFAILHSANLLAGFPADYVAMQILTAFLTGVLYCIAALGLKSILPGIAAHFLSNITGAEGHPAHIWILILVSAVCCLWLGYDIGLTEKERQ